MRCQEDSELRATRTVRTVKTSKQKHRYCYSLSIRLYGGWRSIHNRADIEQQTLSPRKAYWPSVAEAPYWHSRISANSIYLPKNPCHANTPVMCSESAASLPRSTFNGEVVVIVIGKSPSGMKRETTVMLCEIVWVTLLVYHIGKLSFRTDIRHHFRVSMTTPISKPAETTPLREENGNKTLQTREKDFFVLESAVSFTYTAHTASNLRSQ